MPDLVRPSQNRRIEYYAKPASTAFTFGDFVAPNIDATDNTFDSASATMTMILGAIQVTVASTDSDYASETKVPILIDEYGEWEFTVGTGTADANDEQGYIDMDDTTPASLVDVTASTEDHIFVTKYVSGTVVRGRVATNPASVIPVQN